MIHGQTCCKATVTLKLNQITGKLYILLHWIKSMSCDRMVPHGLYHEHPLVLGEVDNDPCDLETSNAA